MFTVFSVTVTGCLAATRACTTEFVALLVVNVFAGCKTRVIIELLEAVNFSRLKTLSTILLPEAVALDIGLVRTVNELPEAVFLISSFNCLTMNDVEDDASLGVAGVE